LREDVINMRRKMRAELDRSNAAGFDLKQGKGGLVDLEFLLQYLVLRDAAGLPALLVPRDTPGLIVAAHGAGTLDDATQEALLSAHAGMLAAGLECTLDRRRRFVSGSGAIDVARASVDAAARMAQLEF
jgi:glutamate-ammonia-ligase adenylyltransferase